MRSLFQSTISRLMALLFEQRRVLANFCGGLALVFTAQLIFVHPGIFNVITASSVAVVLLKIAVIFNKKGDEDV